MVCKLCFLLCPSALSWTIIFSIVIFLALSHACSHVEVKSRQMSFFFYEITVELSSIVFTDCDLEYMIDSESFHEIVQLLSYSHVLAIANSNMY